MKDDEPYVKEEYEPDKEENLYNELAREEMLEDDALDSEEDAFMRGYADSIPEEESEIASKDEDSDKS